MSDPAYQYLPDEKEAIAYFHQVGRAEVERQFEDLSVKTGARFDAIAREMTTPLYGRTAIDFYEPEERALRQKLLLAMMLCTDEKAEAKERIALRVAHRKQMTAARLAAQ